jgi:hypothetical protein
MFVHMDAGGRKKTGKAVSKSTDGRQIHISSHLAESDYARFTKEAGREISACRLRWAENSAAVHLRSIGAIDRFKTT